MPTVQRTKPFDTDFLKLSPKEQGQVLKAIRYIDDNIMYPSSQTHLIEETAFMEAYAHTDLRIIFERTCDKVVLHAVGHQNA